MDDQVAWDKTKNTKRVSEMDAEDYDAIYVSGGVRCHGSQAVRSLPT